MFEEPPKLTLIFSFFFNSLKSESERSCGSSAPIIDVNSDYCEYCSLRFEAFRTAIPPNGPVNSKLRCLPKSYSNRGFSERQRWLWFSMIVNTRYAVVDQWQVSAADLRWSSVLCSSQKRFSDKIVFFFGYEEKKIKKLIVFSLIVRDCLPGSVKLTPRVSYANATAFRKPFLAGSAVLRAGRW